MRYLSIRLPLIVGLDQLVNGRLSELPQVIEESLFNYLTKRLDMNLMLRIIDFRDLEASTNRVLKGLHGTFD